MNHFVLFAVSMFLCACICGCAGMENKAVGVASGVEAIKIETTGSAATGTVLPNVIIGGAVNAVATSPHVDKEKTSSPVVALSRRNSILGEIFGLNCSQESLVYIGIPGETAEQTRQRISNVKELLNSNAQNMEKKK